jgi:hypothetical protein
MHLRKSWKDVKPRGDMAQKLRSVFDKVHGDFIAELSKVMDQPIEVSGDVFEAFASSLDTDKLVGTKVSALNVHDFANLELVPGKPAIEVASSISTIDMVRTFFLYVNILAAIVEQSKDTEPDREEDFLTAMKCANRSEDPGFEPTDSKVSKLLGNVATLRRQEKEQDTEPSPFPMGGGMEGDFLENSSIGRIAKEISEELDISGISKPEDVLNFTDPKNNMIGDIVSKVGTKIHNKLTSGELKQDELLSEAFQLLGNFGGKMPGGGNLSDLMNNPMMKNMMSAMSKQFGAAAGGGGGGGGGAGAGTKVAVNTSKLRNMQTRERLKSKLSQRSPKE